MLHPRIDNLMILNKVGKNTVHVYPFKFPEIGIARTFAKRILDLVPDASLAIIPESELYPYHLESSYKLSEQAEGFTALTPDRNSK